MKLCSRWLKKAKASARVVERRCRAVWKGMLEGGWSSITVVFGARVGVVCVGWVWVVGMMGERISSKDFGLILLFGGWLLLLVACCRIEGSRLEDDYC